MTSFWEEYTETGAGFWDKKATSIPYKGILDMEADFSPQIHTENLPMSIKN